MSDFFLSELLREAGSRTGKFEITSQEGKEKDH
jgi:hypothetical protein